MAKEGRKSKGMEDFDERYSLIEKSLYDVNERLYANVPSLEDLGSLSLGLNDILADNDDLLRDVLDKIDDTEKNSKNILGLGALLTLLSAGVCLVNILAGILFAFASLMIIGKSVKPVINNDLNNLLLMIYAQKSRIISYKKDVISEVRASTKDINKESWYGEELEMLFDIAVRYVEMLLNGEKPNIESYYIDAMVKGLLKDDRYPDASIDELVNIRRSEMGKNKVLKKEIN